MNSPKLSQILTVIALSHPAYCQSTGKIAGIGIGTFIIIIAILFSIFWCLLCRTSARPEIYSAAGILIPVILILIFVLMPKEKDRVVTGQLSDMNFVTHVVFMVISVIAFVLAGVFLCIDYMFGEKKAKNIARSAFVVKEEEEEILTRRSRLANSRVVSQAQRPASSHQNH